MPAKKPEFLEEEDLDKFLEEADEDITDWIDDYLSFLTAVHGGPKKGYNFRFMGKQFWLSIPVWAWEIVDEVAYRENVTRQQLLESSVLVSLLLRIRSWKDKSGTTGMKLQAIKNQLRAAKVMRDVEQILNLVEEDAGFWLKQNRPDSLYKSIAQLVDTIDSVEDPDLKSAAKRYIVQNWDQCRIAATFLQAEGHPKGSVVASKFDEWEKEI